VAGTGTGTVPSSGKRELAARKQKGAALERRALYLERAEQGEERRAGDLLRRRGEEERRRGEEAESSSAVVKLEQRSVLSYGTVRWTTVTATADRLNHTPIAKFRIRMDYNTKFSIPVFGIPILRSPVLVISWFQ
jgi:hypothetical protein